mgnify:FL=1
MLAIPWQRKRNTHLGNPRKVAKEEVLEDQGVEPCTSRMLSERSTDELDPPTCRANFVCQPGSNRKQWEKKRTATRPLDPGACLQGHSPDKRTAAHPANQTGTQKERQPEQKRSEKVEVGWRARMPPNLPLDPGAHPQKHSPNKRRAAHPANQVGTRGEQ